MGERKKYRTTVGLWGSAEDVLFEENNAHGKLDQERKERGKQKRAAGVAGREHQGYECLQTFSTGEETGFTGFAVYTSSRVV